MHTNNRTVARYLPKQPVITHYPPLFAVYSSNGREVIDLVTAEEFLDLPRAVHVEACGTTYLL